MLPGLRGPLGLLLLLFAFLLPTYALPPALPLTVRSPTFNIWVDAQGGGNPAGNWPQFWNDQHIMGWAGYIRVDGVAFHWLGAPIPGNSSTFQSATVTPTRTILKVQAGPVALNVTFLSPIEPDDLARQSFPFSYVYVEGAMTDGKDHTIQLYMDLSGEWVTAGLETPIQWQTQQTPSAAYLQLQRVSPSSNFQDLAEDSTVFHAIASDQPNRQSLVASDVMLRNAIASNSTTLSFTSDLAGTTGQVRNSDGKFPVLAHYLDLGSVSTIPTTAWVMGIVRDPVVTFQGENRHGYYWSKWPTVADAINAFITDFPAAKSRALALDDKILADANKISSDYADLVSLGLRQALAGVEITVPRQSDGTYNTSDVLAFLKDTGNSQRVNPTETIYALMPALLYLNSTLLGALLEPMFRFQTSSAYGNVYAAPDLGTPYPSVPGNSQNNEGVAVEHSANMIIMALAHARASGDGSLISRYYTTLKKWGDYLVNNTLSTSQQTSDARTTVLGQTRGGITNLGVKGIVGVAAMAQISEVVQDGEAAQAFQAAAANLTQTWTTLSSFSGALAWEYSTPGSNGMMYNLFADKLLQLGAFPDAIYAAEDKSFGSVATYGIPLSSDSNSMARSDWSMFSAGAAVSDTARDHLISGVHSRAMLNSANGTFSNLYNVLTGAGVAQGASPNGFATPAQGAIFSLLALNVQNKTISTTPLTSGSTNTSSSSKTDIAPIIGGVVGGVALLGLLVIGALFLRRRKQRERDWNAAQPEMNAAARPWRPPPSLPGTGTGTSMTLSSPISPDSGPPMSYSHFTPTDPYGSGTYLPPGAAPPPPAPIVLGQSFVRPGSKAAQLTPQERNRLFPQGMPPSPTFSGSGGGGGFRSPPQSTAGGSSVTGSGSGTASEELRNEMANLRREVAELRANQDAPPMYQ
ncbi:hypothetical protein MKEN_00219200 [Mycena kentingensis (nom. inval.)]|nr:hypothetical protein MKEN_00219200 [Mycena kentingensis (nom. inval.)]